MGIFCGHHGRKHGLGYPAVMQEQVTPGEELVKDVASKLKFNLVTRGRFRVEVCESGD